MTACDFVDRVVRPPGLRGVVAAPLDGDHDFEPSLLARADQIGHAAIGGVDERAAPLVDAIIGAEQVAVVFRQPLETVGPTRLLIGPGGEDDIAPQLDPGALEQDERHRLGGDGVLHVVRAAPVDAPLVNLSTEGWVGPGPFVLDRHHIGVRQEKQARRARAAAQRRDVVAAIRRGQEDVAVDAVCGELVAQQLGGGKFVAGRHDPGADGGDTDECLAEVDDLLAGRLDRGEQVVACGHSFLRVCKAQRRGAATRRRRGCLRTDSGCSTLAERILACQPCQGHPWHQTLSLGYMIAAQDSNKTRGSVTTSSTLRNLTRHAYLSTPRCSRGRCVATSRSCRIWPSCVMWFDRSPSLITLPRWDGPESLCTARSSSVAWGYQSTKSSPKGLTWGIFRLSCPLTPRTYDLCLNRIANCRYQSGLCCEGVFLLRRVTLCVRTSTRTQYQRPYLLPAEYLLAARQSAGGELV